MAETVIDGLELVEIECEHADRRLLLPLIGLHHQSRAGEKAAAIVEAGQWIGLGRALVAADGAILGKHQHDEGRAHDIERDLDGEDGDPAGRQAMHAEARKRDRKQEDGAVQHRHQQRRPAPDQRFAPFAPQLDRDHERVCGDNHRTQHDAHGGRVRHRMQQVRGRPDAGTGAHRDPMHLAAMEDAGGGPDHAERDEQRYVENALRHREPHQLLQAPDHRGKAADQIGDAPPGERRDAVLHPREQEEQAEQRRHAACGHKQRANIKRRRCFRETREHKRSSSPRWSVTSFEEHS